jgi:hypothetical protein
MEVDEHQDNLVHMRAKVTKKSAKKELLDANPATQSFDRRYSNNTTKEETVLEYVEDFRRQFVQVFPTRKALLLSPTNECGVRKFVCTSVCPTLAPYDDIYDVATCASFVSDFLTYLPLEHPTRLPDLLCSPSTTCELRAGDCLDMAIVLCSLLRGAKYDAFVVSGYAPKWITERDQSHRTAPYTHKEMEVKEEDPPAEPATGGERYGVAGPPLLESSFLQMLEEQKREKEKKERAVAEKNSLFIAEKTHDPLAGERVHCWVLVREGPRGVESSMFVEPTTGAVFPVTDSPYLGVESVWNEINYWANVQGDAPNALVYDLNKTEHWEYVLINESQHAMKDNFSREFDSVSVDRVSVPPEENFDNKDILDAPISWCKPIDIKRADFRARLPKGYKRVQYRACLVEKWSEYTEAKQGMVEKITFYSTPDKVSPIEIREIYMHRKVDKLHMVIRYPLESRKVMIFHPGRFSGLQRFIEITEEPERRVFIFFPKARVDGMMRREEVIGEKVQEFYENRDDFRVYRSISVTNEPEQGHQRHQQSRHKGYRISLAGLSEMPIHKITEKFARNDKVNAEEDVRKRTHFISKGTIRLDYHYGPHKITASQELIDKFDKDQNQVDLVDDVDNNSSGQSSKSWEHRVDSTWTPPSKADKQVFVSKLWMVEKDLLSEIRDREEHVSGLVSDIAKTFDSDMGLISKCEKTIYDFAHEQALSDSTLEKEKEETKVTEHVDYLSPFLAQYPDPSIRPLHEHQAMQAKEECLAALKERLLERASIIQSHLDQENKNLRQRQAHYKRQAGSGQPEADEEFTKYYEEAAFRIEILRSRLVKHEEEAVSQYFEMDKRLNSDPRLSVLKRIGHTDGLDD